jgi:hypothetical protein
MKPPYATHGSPRLPKSNLKKLQPRRDKSKEYRTTSLALSKEEWDFVMRYAAVFYPRTPLGLLRIGSSISDLVRDGIGHWLEQATMEKTDLLQGAADHVTDWPQKKKFKRGDGLVIQKRIKKWGISASKGLLPYARGFAREGANGQKRLRSVRKRSEGTPGRHKTGVAVPTSCQRELGKGTTESGKSEE